MSLAPARARPTNWLDPDYGLVNAERYWRLKRLRAAGKPAWDALISYYRNDHPIDFIEDWCVTYDPRLIPMGKKAHMPFVLYERQRDFIEWLHARFRGRQSGLVEKSRDAGASWLCCAYALWLWLYHPGVAIGFGSQKIENVDKLGVPKSLLEKIRIMIRLLPPELQPIGWNDREHAAYMRISNPETLAMITGDGGDRIGRGDRTSMYFVDEAAFLDQPEAVEGSLSMTTDVRIDVSTANGEGNPFYRRRMSGTVPVFTFHWRDDPRKNDAWYEKMRAEYDPVTIAREVDIDYGASGGDVVIESKWVLASIELRRLLEQSGELRDWLKANTPRRTAGLDVGGGTAPSVFVPRQGPVVDRSSSWMDSDTTNTAGRALVLMAERKCKVLKFDTIGVGKGVASTLLRTKGDLRAWGINTGNRPTGRVWPDGKTARSKFTNLRAELWWTARDRLRKTYEHWLAVKGQGGALYDLSELLLLPADDPKMTGQLSLPRYDFLDGGKIQIERKTRMASRGVLSPDHADAAILTLAPRPSQAKAGRTVGI